MARIIGSVPENDKRRFNEIQEIFINVAPTYMRRKALFNLIKLVNQMETIEDKKNRLTTTLEQAEALTLKYREVNQLLEDALKTFNAVDPVQHRDLLFFVWTSRDYRLGLHNSWDKFEWFLDFLVPWFKNV